MEMQAAILERTVDSHDFVAENAIQVQSVEVPEPTGEEVRVDIGAASLCHTDVSIALGFIDESYPMVTGHEGAGVVRDVGEDVTDVEPGDTVVLGRIACGECEYCRRGRSNLCVERAPARTNGTLRTGEVRFSRDGGPVHHCHAISSFCETTITTEDVTIGIRDDLPVEYATLLGCGIFTGAGSVMNAADVEANSSLVLFGVGGVGLTAVQAAAARSAGDIIAVDIVDEKLEMARTLGATHAINSREEDVVERVHEITDGGADYSFEFVGSPQVVEQLLPVLAPTGEAILVGTSPAGVHDVGIDLIDFMTGEKTLRGAFNGSYNLKLAIPDLADMIAEGVFDLDPLITDTRPITELNEAMEALEDGSQIRQIITPEA
jgi:Zn-dependent alcohol dehydrogenase